LAVRVCWRDGWDEGCSGFRAQGGLHEVF
jgi:hypothetical protein